MSTKTMGQKLATLGIAALCFGYFASYIPYSMMTKMITKGWFAGMDGKGFSGFEIQPVVVFGTFVAMYLFITLKGWWKFATHSKVFGVSVPRPQWFTLISGLCTSGVIITTTLAYTFSGISIVFAMLLMRGGVLVLAPIIDAVAKRKRKIYWPSWVAAALSFGALFVAINTKDTRLTFAAGLDVAIYLFSYFFRLFFMSNKAKSDDSSERKRYFVEEQMVANPSLVIAVVIVGLIGSQMAPESIPGKLWSGLTAFPYQGYVLHAFLIGVFSYGTGLFGSLIFLDKRENTFTVPANRVSSVIAGVIATYLLAMFYGEKYPPSSDLIGVALILAAIFFLSHRAVVEKRNKAAEKKRLIEIDSQLTPATENQ